MFKRYGIAALLLFGLSLPVQAQMVVPTEPIRFPAGSNTAVVQHTIVGKEVYGYTFDAQAGQSVTITLEAVTPSANFVLARSGDPAGLYSSMTGDRSHTEILSEGGEYVIRLLLVGQAAETGSSEMTLTVALGGGARAGSHEQRNDADGLSGGPDFWEVHGLSPSDRLNIRAGAGTDQAVVGTVGNGDILVNGGCSDNGGTIWCAVATTDGSGVSGWASSAYLREGYAPDPGGEAKVEGTNYNAVGSIPCTIEANAAVSRCEFGVTRGRPGLATVFITLPNGFVRVISFSGGEVSPQSAVAAFSYDHAGDETSITIDNGAETYVVPDAVVFGG